LSWGKLTLVEINWLEINWDKLTWLYNKLSWSEIKCVDFDEIKDRIVEID
jgi:hypothetical protein